MEKHKRIEWVDIAKGIAIILVVIGHVGSSYSSAGLYKDSFLLNFTNRFVYSFHMAAFMFISGFLFRNKQDKKQQVKAILISYGIPYVFFSGVWWGFKTVLSSVVNTKLSLWDLVLTPVFPISFMWFIYALMLMEIIQVIVGKLEKTKIYVHLGVAFVLLVIQPYIASKSVFNTEYVFSDLIISDVMSNYFYFCIGVHFGNRIISVIKEHRTIISWGGGLLGVNLLSYSMNITFNIIGRVAIAFLGIVFLISLSMGLDNKVLSFIGRRTLPIYVLHGIFIAATRIVLGKIGLNDLYGISPLFICTAVGVLVPLSIYEICAKWNFDFFYTPMKLIRK